MATGDRNVIVKIQLLAGVSAAAMLVGSPAFAQDAPPAPSEETTEAAPAPQVEIVKPEPAAPSGGEIVVTGSRIRRTEATSTAPLQIIDPTLSRQEGNNSTAEMVQSSPIAAGSSQTTAAISTNAVTNGGPGTQTINLRGLGAERTLVLLNGRRAGPAGTRGAVSAFDLNVLPSGIIRSIEILKDGASSIYGSDAIAGVVNILTKKDTDGIELNAFGTLHQHKGGEQVDFNATWGKEFDRGHILVSADYYKQNMLRREDRKFLGCPEDYMFRSDLKTRADLIDPRTGKPRCNGVVWGHVWTYYAYNLPDFPQVVLLQPDYGQNLGQYLSPPQGPGAGINQLLIPRGYYAVSTLADPIANALTNLYHPFEAKSSVIPKTQRYTGYADASYEITDNIELYGEFLYSKRKTETDSFVQIYNFGYAGTAPFEGDPFPGFYQPRGGFVLLSPTGIADKYDNTIDVDYYRAVGGVTGKLFSDWRFDAYGQYSHNLGKYTYDQILADSIASQSYKTGSCVGTFTPIANKPCIDINWVDPNLLAGRLTQEQTDFLFGTETGKTKYDQHYLEASANGSVIDLPAGPVGLAIGATWRRDEIDDQPGNITQAPNPFFDPSIPAGDPACSDSTNPCDEFVNNGFSNPISSGHTFGHSVTKEAFGEINIPILKDSAIAKSLEFAGAARITNVKAVRGSDGFTASSKGNWTYKLQGNWQVTDWVRLRSTYGTSYRAPALFEQFLANQADFDSQRNVDPCVRWAEGLANGTITQRIADNCAADQTFVGGPATGIAPDHSGAGIQVTLFRSGGIGVLEPETSRALTASIILTPKISVDHNVALTIDFFDIKVKGEITQLGADNILRGCYNSLDFPNDQLCTLFERGQDGDPQNVRNVFDKFININRQHNRGLDFTLRTRHVLGGIGTLSFLANATYQLKDDITLFGGTIDNLNGEIGDPKLAGDLNTTLVRGPTTLFWGVDFIGKSSNKKQFIQDNGALCNFNQDTIDIFGDYCYKVNTARRFYHSISITQKFGSDERLELTAGVSNLFDTRPPRISTPAVSSLGQVPFVSQYDWLGRRLFVSAKIKL